MLCAAHARRACMLAPLNSILPCETYLCCLAANKLAFRSFNCEFNGRCNSSRWSGNCKCRCNALQLGISVRSSFFLCFRLEKKRFVNEWETPDMQWFFCSRNEIIATHWLNAPIDIWSQFTSNSSLRQIQFFRFELIRVDSIAGMVLKRSGGVRGTHTNPKWTRRND